MTEDARIAGLRAALDADPDNDGLRLVLAEQLADGGHADAAAAQFEQLADRDALDGDAAARAALLAIDAGDLRRAGRFVEVAHRAGSTSEQLAVARQRLTDALRRSSDDAHPDPDELDDLARAVQAQPAVPTASPLGEDEALHFADVAGLEDVKRTIRRSIIDPYLQPELYASFGRRAGSGCLLYGPPGCGKTMLARATAGECGLPFVNVRIEDVISAFRGESERNLHALFEHARASAPCVLFIDELDALGYARRRQPGSEGRTLVNTLLQELDAIGASNDGLLVLAATNAPWDVDDALKRPGRFDHFVFVPPPDAPAREFLLTAQLQERPTDDVDARSIAAATDMFSGADLVAVVERAIDSAIDRSLDAGSAQPIRQDDLSRALAQRRATTIEWLLAARNHAEFANESGQYDELRDYLGSRAIKRVLKRA